MVDVIKKMFGGEEVVGEDHDPALLAELDVVRERLDEGAVQRKPAKRALNLPPVFGGSLKGQAAAPPPFAARLAPQPPPLHFDPVDRLFFGQRGGRTVFFLFDAAADRLVQTDAFGRPLDGGERRALTANERGLARPWSGPPGNGPALRPHPDNVVAWQKSLHEDFLAGAKRLGEKAGRQARRPGVDAEEFAAAESRAGVLFLGFAALSRARTAPRPPPLPDLNTWADLMETVTEYGTFKATSSFARVKRAVDFITWRNSFRQHLNSILIIQRTFKMRLRNAQWALAGTTIQRHFRRAVRIRRFRKVVYQVVEVLHREMKRTGITLGRSKAGDETLRRRMRKREKIGLWTMVTLTETETENTATRGRTGKELWDIVKANMDYFRRDSFVKIRLGGQRQGEPILPKLFPQNISDIVHDQINANYLIRAVQSGKRGVINFALLRRLLGLPEILQRMELGKVRRAILYGIKLGLPPPLKIEGEVYVKIEKTIRSGHERIIAMLQGLVEAHDGDLSALSMIDLSKLKATTSRITALTRQRMAEILTSGTHVDKMLTIGPKIEDERRETVNVAARHLSQLLKIIHNVHKTLSIRDLLDQPEPERPATLGVLKQKVLDRLRDIGYSLGEATRGFVEQELDYANAQLLHCCVEWLSKPQLLAAGQKGGDAEGTEGPPRAHEISHFSDLVQTAHGSAAGLSRQLSDLDSHLVGGLSNSKEEISYAVRKRAWELLTDAQNRIAEFLMQAELTRKEGRFQELANRHLDYIKVIEDERTKWVDIMKKDDSGDYPKWPARPWGNRSVRILRAFRKLDKDIVSTYSKQIFAMPEKSRRDDIGMMLVSRGPVSQRLAHTTANFPKESFPESWIPDPAPRVARPPRPLPPGSAAQARARSAGKAAAPARGARTARSVPLKGADGDRGVFRHGTRISYRAVQGKDPTTAARAGGVPRPPRPPSPPVSGAPPQGGGAAEEDPPDADAGVDDERWVPRALHADLERMLDEVRQQRRKEREAEAPDKLDRIELALDEDDEEGDYDDESDSYLVQQKWTEKKITTSVREMLPEDRRGQAGDESFASRRRSMMNREERALRMLRENPRLFNSSRKHGLPLLPFEHPAHVGRFRGEKTALWEPTSPPWRPHSNRHPFKSAELKKAKLHEETVGPDPHYMTATESSERHMREHLEEEREHLVSHREAHGWQDGLRPDDAGPAAEQHHEQQHGEHHHHEGGHHHEAQPPAGREEEPHYMHATEDSKQHVSEQHDRVQHESQRAAEQLEKEHAEHEADLEKMHERLKHD